MSLLSLDHMSKEYQARWVRGSFASRVGRFLMGDRRDGRRRVLDDISIEIKEGERWGLLGPNGSGKTTLLKIIAGILRPSSGTVRIHGKVTPFFSWYVGFLDDLDGYENIFLYGSLFGLTRHEIKNRLDAILSFSGLEPFLYEKLRTYSTGMKARLAFAIGMQTNANLFLFDEIFSVGDKAFQEKCADAIRESSKNGRAIILASHDNQLINDITKKCLLLDQGKPIACGPTGDVLATYGSRG